MGIRKRNVSKSFNKNGYVWEADYYYFENGMKKRITKSGFKTKKEAQQFIQDKQLELNEHGRIIRETTKTLNQVFEEFLEIGSSQYQSNTLYHTKRDHKYFKDSIGKARISMIDYKILQKFFNDRGHEGLETNKSIRKTLNRVFVYAQRADYIRDNPITAVIVTGVDNSREKTIISNNDFERLILALEAKSQFRYDAYIIAMKIGFYTGLRISEVLALNKSDFDLDNDLVYIGKKLVSKGLNKPDYYVTSDMKSKKSKSILPIPSVLKEELIKWFDRSPYEIVVCDPKGHYINPDCLSNEVKRVAKKLNIHFNFHMLRHTYATTLVTNNVDIKTAQELMRHSNFNTTLSLYTHIEAGHKKKVVDEIFQRKVA